MSPIDPVTRVDRIADGGELHELPNVTATEECAWCGAELDCNRHCTARCESSRRHDRMDSGR